MEALFYNHEQKERYMAAREHEYRSIRSIGRVFFKITKSFEEDLNKDCSNFTTREILSMYNACFTTSWERLLNFNSQLKIYTSWCLKEGLVVDNQNHYEELDKTDMYNCLNIGLKKRMIVTRKELERTIMDFPNPSDQFMALAFFEGLGGFEYKDFNNLMPEQFVGDKVILSDRELTVSKLLVEKAIESAQEYDKYSHESKKRVGFNKNDPSIIKDSCNATDDDDSGKKTVRKIQRRAKAIEKEYGKAYSFVGLRNSGRIEMLNKFMEEDKSSDPRQTYEKHREEIEYRYGKLQRIVRWVEENEEFLKPSK